MVTLDSTVSWGEFSWLLQTALFLGENSHGYFRQHCFLGRILMVTLHSTVCWRNSHGYFRQYCLLEEFSWLLQTALFVGAVLITSLFSCVCASGLFLREHEQIMSV